jgi:hypothetical protein
MARTLTIFQHGPTSFAVCGRCNGKSESKLLDLLKATEEIQDKYESHKCKRVSPKSHKTQQVPSARPGASETVNLCRH